jgi:hypothetical protein
MTVRATAPCCQILMSLVERLPDSVTPSSEIAPRSLYAAMSAVDASVGAAVPGTATDTAPVMATRTLVVSTVI